MVSPIDSPEKPVAKAAPRVHSRRRALTAFLAVLVCIALAEGVARVAYHPLVPIDDHIKPPDHPHRYLGFTEMPIVKRYGPNARPGTGRSTVRILCMGSDTTRNGYPARLREALAARGIPKEKVTVLDASCTEYSSMESQLCLMIYGLPAEPDYVLVMHGYNDVKARMVPNFKPDYTHFRRDPWQKLSFGQELRKRAGELMACSRLAVLLRDLATAAVSKRRVDRGMSAQYYDENGSFVPPSLSLAATGTKVFETHMGNIHAVCKGRGVQAVFITEPLHPEFRQFCHSCHTYSGGPQSARMPDMDRIEDVVSAHMLGQKQTNDAVRKLARQLDVALVDWAKESNRLPGDAVFADIIRLHDGGHQALADLVALKLEKLIREGKPGVAAGAGEPSKEAERR